MNNKYTDSLTSEQVDGLRTWFGTPKHAYAVLRLERDVPFPMLQRVWAGHAVSRIHRDHIRRRLNFWASETLRTTAPEQFHIDLAALDALPYDTGAEE